jgi:hypothetical protein
MKVNGQGDLAPSTLSVRPRKKSEEEMRPERERSRSEEAFLLPSLVALHFHWTDCGTEPIHSSMLIWWRKAKLEGGMVRHSSQPPQREYRRWQILILVMRSTGEKVLPVVELDKDGS